MAVNSQVADGATSTPVKGTTFGYRMLSVTRIAVGFYFLWAFLDKLLGLGYSTCRTVAEDGTATIAAFCERAWIHGGHVTEGYLGSATGPFADFYQGLAEQRWTDWIFMLGLLGIGLALMLGIGTRVAGVAAPLMLVMMYTSHMWPTTNPFLDEHIIYALAVIGIVWVELGRQEWGLGTWWRKLPIVQKNRWLI